MSNRYSRAVREQFWWWFVPLCLTLVLLVYLAWKQAGAASNPFTYDLG